MIVSNSLCKSTKFIYEGVCPHLTVGILDEFFNNQFVTGGGIEDMVENVMCIFACIGIYSTLCHESLKARSVEVVMPVS